METADHLDGNRPRAQAGVALLGLRASVASIVEPMNWFCIHSKPQKEASAERYCREQFGLETFYPQLKRRKTIRRVKRWIVGPLFPRYFFCRLALGEHYRAVRYAPEVIDIVNFGDRPIVVEDAIISALRSWAGEAVDVVTIHPPPKPGDLVEITDGPFRGLQAIVERDMSDHERVAVLLSTLALSARVIVNRAQLAPVG